MFNIERPEDLPTQLRSAGTYRYLNTGQNEYWLHALSVAHDLLAKRAAVPNAGTYYQDQFAADFIAGLARSDIAADAKVIGAFEINRGLTKEQLASDTHWIGYRTALAEIKELGRGFAIVVRSVYGAESHWEARVCLGSGQVSECATLARTQSQPAHDDIVKSMLSYEAFLARSKAEREIATLANFSRIVELKLRPGTRLSNVESNYNGATRKYSACIGEIYPSGSLRLIEAKMRGSSKNFQLQIEARDLAADNLYHLAPAPVRKPIQDTCTLALF